MPLTKEQVEQALEAPASENKPKPIKGTAMTGPKAPPIAPKEARRRREVVARLLMDGVSTDRIIEALARPSSGDSPGFGLNEKQSMDLIREVQLHWEAEDQMREPYDKSAAVRRHLNHIRTARDRGQFQAVATLEKNLSLIQGTWAEQEVTVNHSTVGESMMRVLGSLRPERIRELVEEQLEYERKRKPIDTQGEEV